MDDMTIDKLVALQAKALAGEDHVVYVGEDKWVIAHTDEEREQGLEVMVDCELNDWMESWGGPPVSPGVYLAIPYEDDWELIHVEDNMGG